jgi:hypothetical protein
MLLQAKSIEIFLKPGTTHWVFINEEPDKLFNIDWNHHLSQYYKNHNLNIIYCDPKYWSKIHNGWVIQQIHKFEISKVVDNDYMLLDSKNFFVVPTNLETWIHEGSGILISPSINLDVYKLWNKTTNFYGKNLKFEKLIEYYAPETPFIIRNHIIKEAIKEDKFIEMFINGHLLTGNASEFIYYSYFLKLLGHTFKYNRRHHSLWPECQNIDGWFKEDNFSLMEISGIHRIWLETATLENKEKLKSWLDSLNLIDQNTVQLFD